LFDKHYSVAPNIVVGIVSAATAVIIPFESFGTSILSALANILCLAAGIALARLLSRLNSRYDSKKTKSEC
jgi:putative membrane protein